MVAPSNQLPPATKTTLGAAEIAPKWDSRYSGHVPHDASYYGKCVLGGILACGLTHTVICPLDVTKCNMQVSLRFCSPGIFDKRGQCCNDSLVLERVKSVTQHTRCLFTCSVRVRCFSLLSTHAETAESIEWPSCVLGDRYDLSFSLFVGQSREVQGFGQGPSVNCRRRRQPSSLERLAADTVWLFSARCIQVWSL